MPEFVPVSYRVAREQQRAATKAATPAKPSPTSPCQPVYGATRPSVRGSDWLSFDLGVNGASDCSKDCRRFQQPERPGCHMVFCTARRVHSILIRETCPLAQISSGPADAVGTLSK